MNQELLNQYSLPSLVRNGNFTSGMSHWFGCYYRHTEITPDGAANPDSNAPKYAAQIMRVSAEHYPPGIDPGLSQFIDRTDIFNPVSRRRVRRLSIVPFGIDRAYVSIIINSGESNTSVDGYLIQAAPYSDTPKYSNYFQHPFVFRDSEHIVPISAGSELELSDTTDGSLTGKYRASKVRYNYGNGSTDENSVLVNTITYHVLEITPSSGGTFKSILSENSKYVKSITVSFVPFTNRAQITITGDVAQLKLIASNRGTGLKISDIVRFYSPLDRAGRISAITYTSTTVVLTLEPILESGLTIYPFIDQDFTATAFEVFNPAKCDLTITKPLVQYSLTLAYTYRERDGAQALDSASLGFCTIDSGSFTGTYQTTGLGEFTDDLAKLEERTLYFPETNQRYSKPDSVWRRRITHFFRESVEPIEGRLLLRLIPKEYGYDFNGINAITGYNYSAPFTAPDGTVYDTGVLTVTCTGDAPTALAADSRVWFEHTTTDADSIESWPVVQIPLQNPWTVDSVTEDGFGNLVLTFIPVTALTLGSEDNQYTCTSSDSAKVYGVSNVGQSMISDVYLVRGNYTEQFVSNDANAWAQLYTDSDRFSNKLFDDLEHGLDEYESIVPKGAVILYCGSETCPPGFKRITNYAGATKSEHYEISAPSTVEYDEATNRSTLTWLDESLALTDDNGAEIPIWELAQSAVITIPGSQGTERIDLTPVQPIIQPGTSIRVQEIVAPSTLTDNPLFSLTPAYSEDDYRLPFESREHSYLVTDIDFSASTSTSATVLPSALPYMGVGPYSTGAGTISYPYTISENQLRAQQLAYTPTGPNSADQDLTFDIESSSGVKALTLNGYWITTSASDYQMTIRFQSTTAAGIENITTFHDALVTGDNVLDFWLYNTTGTNRVEFAGHILQIGDITQDPNTPSKYYFDTTVERYDKNLLQLPTMSTGDYFVVRPVKLFGTGTQGFDPVNRKVTSNGFIMNYVTYEGHSYWIVRKVSQVLIATVAGKFPTVAKCYLEPSGYLKYDQFKSKLDCGTGGHTHRLGEVVESITVDNLIPRVAEHEYPEVPYTPLPVKHHHGYLNQYRWPLPKFKLFTACEKL